MTNIPPPVTPETESPAERDAQLVDGIQSLLRIKMPGESPVTDDELRNAHIALWMAGPMRNTGGMAPTTFEPNVYYIGGNTRNENKIEELAGQIIKARKALVDHVRPAVEAVLGEQRK